jgi:hypothetical protein
VEDTAGVQISPVLTWGSNYPASATAATASTGSPGGTVTAVVAGTTAITATCSNPDCNAGLPAAYSSNFVTITVPGGDNTKIYAGSTKSTSLVPIAASSDTTGTAITLPQIPNSIVATATGTKVYLGSSSTLMQVDVASGTVTTASVGGNVLAVSPDGNLIAISDNTNSKVTIYSVPTSSVLFSHPLTATSAAFTPDSKTVWFFNGTSGFSDSVSSNPIQFLLGYTPDAVAFYPTGIVGYFTSSATHQVDVRSTCDRSEIQALAANSPTLIATLPTGSGAVVADSPNLDLVTTTGFGRGCPTTASSTINPVNLGLGAFNAKQLFVSADTSNAWLISDLPELVGFNIAQASPFAIPLAGSATPISGGIRLDGQEIYLGATDGKVHRVDVPSRADAIQITVGLKDSSGNAVNPDLVAVVP